MLAMVVAMAIGMLAPPIAQAAIMRQGQRITVERGTTLHDDLFAAGSTIIISGTLDGDLYAAGQEITIEGTVTGNVIAAGQAVRVTGSVGGSVIGAGENVRVEGSVGKDVIGAGSRVEIANNATVTRDVIAAGNTVGISGRVGRNATLGGQTVVVDGAIAGGLRAEANRVELRDSATVGGDFTYRADNPASVASGAQVGGTTRRLPGRVQHRATPGERFAFGIVGWLRSLIGLLLFALIIGLLFPRFLGRSAEQLLGDPLPSLGVGFLVLVGTPIVVLFVIVLGALAGGWWIGLMLLAVWWIALVVGYVCAAAALGHLLFRRTHLAALWSLLLGVLIISIISAIPVLGWLVAFVALLLGLGAVVLAVLRPPQAEAPGAPMA